LARELDPYVEVIPTNTTAFLPIVLSMPGLQTTVHITLYMPTHGRDTEFVSDLAELRNCMDELKTRFTDPIIYIRGDGNVNSNNDSRVVLLQQLILDYNLARTETGHHTYHHFVGNGMYDSDIDILLHSKGEHISEAVTEVLCKYDNPDILSHHDVILSSFTIPSQVVSHSKSMYDPAPKIDHVRTKIEWSDEGQAAYCELVSPHLRQVREDWLDASSQLSMSVALSITSEILTKCATMTNNFKIAGCKPINKSRNVPKAIRLATNKLIKAHKDYKNAENLRAYPRSSRAKDVFISTKKKLG
jgi:hypothetical protein